MFADAFAKEPKPSSLGAILEAIKVGRYAEPIEKLRALRASDGNAYQLEKRKLPAFLISGTAASRTEPLTHSGLLQVDMDKLDGTLETVREKVKSDPHVAFGFVSPSGDGLKLGLRIDGTRHLESFEAARDYFRQTYGVAIDPAVKDRLRLCFVSHDPDLWTNDNAEPLPLPASAPEANEWPEIEGETDPSAAPSILVLPSGSVSISESARVIFRPIAQSRKLFWRGGAIVELVNVDGTPSLEILRPDSFRSRIERHGKVFAWRAGEDGKCVLKPALVSKDTAAAIMASTEAREFLPQIASVLRCPVIIQTASGEVKVLCKGYHTEQGELLIVDGEPPPQVSVDEASASLKWIVSEFDFQSEGDRSRALAALITPALRIGGFLTGNVAIDAAEADQSQSGKGYRHDLVCNLYREFAYVVTCRQGGVGSVDESFAAALVSGRPFVQLDNLRGRLDSQHLESFLTAPGLFPARVPHRGELLINPRRFLVQLSSNGLEATRDLANRASICRIRKRPGFAYRDTLGELQSRQPYFLGCVFAIVAEWVASGKPRTKDCRHDFREWNQTLDWICQNLLGTAPLMDGHEAAQERVSNPALAWLRLVSLAVESEKRIGESLIASELCELCDLHGVEIPGESKAGSEDNIRAGRLLRRVFKDGNSVDVDGFQITRAVYFQTRHDGGAIEGKNYTFSKP